MQHLMHKNICKGLKAFLKVEIRKDKEKKKEKKVWLHPGFEPPFPGLVGRRSNH